MHAALYLIVLLIASLLTIVVAVLAWHRRHVPSARALEWLTWSVAVWALFYTVELQVPAFEAKLLASRLQYLGTVGVPVAWLVFTQRYAGNQRWPGHRTLALLSVIPLITLGLVWTNDLHGLVWSSVGLESDTPLPALEVEHGPWFWVHTVYFYLLMILGSITMLRVIRRSPRLYRPQIGVLLICMLAPWLGNMLYLFKIGPLYPLSLTPLGFLTGTLALGWLLFRHGVPNIDLAYRVSLASAQAGTAAPGPAALPRDDRHTILNLIALGLLASMPISMRGGMIWVSSHFAPWLASLLEIAISATAVGLALLLLWRVGARLTAALVETRAANAALRESEARYHAISDLTTDTIYALRVTEDGRTELEWISDSFESATGYALDDLREQTVWLKIVHPADLEIERRHDAALRAGQSDVCEYRIITKQGQVRWFRDYARPVWNADRTRVVQILGASQDITKPKQSAATQQFLAQAGKLLASSLDYETTLVHVAELAIPQLADWCMIHLVDADYTLRRVALTFADPAKQPLADELRRDYPLSMDAPHGYPRVIRTGQPELAPEVPDEALQRIAHNQRHLELLRALGFCSTISVPLIARDRTIGSIMLGSAESQRRYTEDDLQVAQELASLVALAVDNARLFAVRTSSEQRLRRQNEELTGLHEMTLGLIDQLDIDSLLSALVHRAGGLVGSEHGYLYVLNQEASELVVRVGSGIFANQLGYRLHRGQGLAGRVWETGQPFAIENYQVWSKGQADLDRLQLQAVVAVPICAGAELVGVLGLAYFEQARIFGQAEIELLQRFADMASLALVNARLYSAAQQELAERRHTETALLEAEANLRAAKELAEAATQAKSDLLSQMSHDMRTPLSSVIGITGLLEETNLDTEQRKLVGIIRTSGEVLLALVSNLLDLAKIESGKLPREKHPFNLQECIEEAIDLVASDVTAKQLDLAYTLALDLPAVMVGDHSRLRQILVNLLSNAVKFTQSGGILLAADGQPAADGQYEIHMRVADTGIGIPADRLDQVFQPFERVNSAMARPTPGTGLGLAIAKQLSELMGGRMWIESVVGEGSAFHFTICIAAVTDPAITGLPPALEAEIAALRDRRLLVVDHNTQSRHALEVYAQALRMHIDAVSMANQALALAEAGARFDLAIVDLRDAAVDGRWLGTLLREQYGMPDMRLILLTPLGMRDDEIAGGPFDLTVHKPLKLSQLRNVLLELSTGARFAEVGSSTPAFQQSQAWQHDTPPPRVLLVEDNQANQELGVRILQLLGCPHTAVSTGTQALDALARDRYDLVLLDVQLPDIDGLEVARRIRSRGAQAPQPYLIALTADTQTSTWAACMRAGMDYYIAKPFQMHDLHAALAQYHKSLSSPQEPANLRRAAGETAPLLIAPSSAYPLDAPTLERLRALFGPHRARLHMLMEHYCTDAAGLLLRMKEAAAGNDPETLRASAHQLKSSSRVVAALRLAALSERLEQALDGSQADEWLALLDQLEQEFMRVRAALEATD